MIRQANIGLYYICCDEDECGERIHIKADNGFDAYMESRRVGWTVLNGPVDRCRNHKQPERKKSVSGVGVSR